MGAQIEANASPTYQFHDRFLEPFSKRLVAITILSHALCEAVINAILAVGLAHNKTPELFASLERADLKYKWLTAPQAFKPSYNFPKSSHLYGQLNELCKERNATVHSKVSVEIGEEQLIEGVDQQEFTYESGLKWAKNMTRLPYELFAHARTQLPEGMFAGILFDR